MKFNGVSTPRLQCMQSAVDCLMQQRSKGKQFLIEITTPLREITCPNESHRDKHAGWVGKNLMIVFIKILHFQATVAIHPASTTFPPLPQPKLVLDLATP